MANIKFTELPSTSSATLADIYAVVQGGTTVQITGQQISDLMNVNAILSNAGDPNGSVAGDIYELCWDTTNLALYICTTSGTSATAVWTLVANSNFGSFTWNNVTSTTQVMSSNNGYIANNSSQVIFTLPTVAAIGTRISVVGNGSGGWKIAQNASQILHVGSSASTTGVTGYIESTNRYDSVDLICTVANTEWVTWGGVQGIITVA